MSQSLSLQLSDVVYDAIRCEAELSGLTPAEVAAASLEHEFSVRHQPSGSVGEQIDTRTEAEKEEARRRFERHFGSVNLGYPTGCDNEGIDADLAREYADNHEDD